MLRILAAFIVTVSLVACGGGSDASNSTSGGAGATGSTAGNGSAGGSGNTGSTSGAGNTGTGSTGSTGGGTSGTGSGTSGYTAGVFPPSSTFAGKCATPRTGTDPNNGNQPYPDVQGTSTDENNFLRSWTNELYLWYSEVPDLDPANYATPDYFALLKTSGSNPSGTPKDKFHFTQPTSLFEQQQSGVSLGYGAIFFLANATVPRTLVVAYVQPASTAQPSNPALANNMVRGETVLSIDGIDVVNTPDSDAASVAILNEALVPTKAATHTFVLQEPGSTATRTVSLSATAIHDTTVPLAQKIAQGGTQVGYLLFNDQLASSEAELIAAINQLQGVGDLFLDLRYNGGGYLDIASELAYMIGGAHTGGESGVFDSLRFNDKYTTTNPVTGQALQPEPFHTTTQGYSVTAGQSLPTLGLSRVYVLTGPDTCSASEAIINGLRGVGVQVYQFGSTTCGKPYGSYAQDNCGTTYLSIQYQGYNAQGVSDYVDGFSPANTIDSPGVTLPGCSVGDDFGHVLGDPDEGLLSAALAYRSNPSSCPVPLSGYGRASLRHMTRPVDGGGVIARSPLHETALAHR